MRRLLAAAMLCALSSPAVAVGDQWDLRSPAIAGKAASPRLVRVADAPANQSLVTAAAIAAGVPVHLAHGVIRVESGYRAHIRGAAGEYGIGQIKCQTARSVGFAGSCAALFDARINLTYSMRYLRLALNRGGESCAGVSLYQRGIYARPGCTGYGRKVMASASR